MKNTKNIFKFLLLIILLAQHKSLKSQNTFIENKGQFPANVISKTILPSGVLFLEKGKFTYVFYDSEELIQKHKGKTSKESVRAHAYTVSFINKNPSSKSVLKEESMFFENYFTGKKKHWATKVKSYKRHIQTNIYEGIDLEVFVKNNKLKFELYVAENYDPSEIKLQYKGLESLRVINNKIVSNTSVNQIIEHKPFAYQIINGKTVEVLCLYKLYNNTISFSFPNGYNKTHKLIIDPTLEFSTYSGSNADNFGYTATFDDFGFLYSGSTVFGVGYPTTLGAYDISYNNTSGGTDIAITKYDSSGTQRIYSTYIGGTKDELPHSMIVNSADELFVFGTTGSSDFPITPFAYQTTFKGGTGFSPSGIGVNFPNGSDMFVSRISTDGGLLLASTFIGGSENDGLNTAPKLKYNYADEVRGEIDIDKNNNIYIATSTQSTDFPVTNSIQMNSNGNQEGCIVKMDNQLTAIIWSSYLGGSNDDAIYSLAIDDSDNIYVTGGTNSFDFPTTTNAFLDSYQDSIRADAFITKISSDGNQILSSSYYGTDQYDQSYFVEIGKNKSVYLLGQTKATGMSLVNNVNYFQNGGGQFIAVFSEDLSLLLRSTVVGTGNGTPDISPTAFLVDVCNKIYISGWGSNLGGPLSTLNLPVSTSPPAYQQNTDGNDFYLMVLDDEINNMLYATYFGGSQSNEHVDGGTSRFDKKGIIYQSVCAGCGGYSDFPIEPIPGAVSSTNNSANCNNGVFKFNFNFPTAIADFNAPWVGCNPIISFQNLSSFSPTASYQWNFDDGNTSTQESPAHNFSQPGQYNITLIVTDPASCNISDTITKQIYILSNSSDTLMPKIKCVDEPIQIGLLPANDPTITYTWIPDSSLTSASVSNPFCNTHISREYSLIISSGSCTDTLRQEVVVNNPEVKAPQDTTYCKDEIFLSAICDSSIQSIIWSSNNNFTDTISNSRNIVISNTGTFYVKVVEQNCENIDSVKITPGEIILDAGKDTTYCNDPILLSAISDSIISSIIWSSNNNFTDTISQTNTMLAYSVGEYYVKAVYGLCESTDSIFVASENINILLFANDTCKGGRVFVGVNNLNPANPIISYDWHTTSPNNSSIVEFPDSSRWYSVEVTNNEGCTMKDSIFVNIFPNPTIDSLWITDSIIFKGESIVVTIETNDLINWHDFNTSDPIQEEIPFHSKCYYVDVYNEFNCIIYDSVCVKIVDIFCDEDSIVIPTAFSPNNDRINDTYFIVDKTGVIKDFHLEIFNRLGQKVFSSVEINKKWDGSFMNQPLPPQVFDFYIELICVGDKKLFKKGNITLIR